MGARPSCLRLPVTRTRLAPLRRLKFWTALILLLTNPVLSIRQGRLLLIRRLQLRLMGHQ